MRNLFSLISFVYRGYAGDGESHILRILLATTSSMIVGMSPISLNKETISTIAVIVSVLAGFSFTALFSNHSHSVSDLPAPKSESDRQDIATMSRLFENFRNRSRYFLFISLLCLLFSFFIGIPLDFDVTNIKFSSYISNYFYAAAIDIYTAGCWLARVSCLFLFFEILYSFYRLSQTIFAILDIRREYLDAQK